MVLSLLRQSSAVVLILSLGFIANALLVVALVVHFFDQNAAWEVACFAADGLWRPMQRIFEVNRNGESALTFSGDEVPKHESAIVICNHQSYNDYLHIQALAIRLGMLGRCRYFAKKELVWKLPFFGISLWLIGMILIDRRWTDDEHRIRETFKHVSEGKKRPVWVISYLEGTRKTEKNILKSQEFSRQKGKPVLNEVQFPRTKGFVATVQGLRGSHVQVVYDLTLVTYSPKDGFQSPLSMADLYGCPDLARAGWKFHLHVRRTLIKDLPEEPEALALWVEQTWVNKDRVLKEMRTKWTDTSILKEEGSGVRAWPYWGGRETKKQA